MLPPAYSHESGNDLLHHLSARKKISTFPYYCQTVPFKDFSYWVTCSLLTNNGGAGQSEARAGDAPGLLPRNAPESHKTALQQSLK